MSSYYYAVFSRLQVVWMSTSLYSCVVFSCFQVVWVSMQNEFIKQYNMYVELINKCYLDSNITLEFSMEDVLQFFSNIAQSH